MTFFSFRNHTQSNQRLHHSRSAYYVSKLTCQTSKWAYILLQFFTFYCAKFLKLIKFITSCFSLLNSFLLSVFSTFSLFLKSLSNNFFSKLAYKSLLNRFSALIDYSVLCGLPIFFLYPAVSHIFHGSGFLQPRVLWVWIQVQGPSLGFKSSHLITVSLLFEICYYFVLGWNSMITCKQKFHWII